MQIVGAERESRMMYGNTRQTLIRPANHHPSPCGRQVEQLIPTNGKKGGGRFASGPSRQTRWTGCKWKTGGEVPPGPSSFSDHTYPVPISQNLTTDPQSVA